MATKTKTKAPADNIGDEYDDGLWPDMRTSAESSVHENLPKHFEGEDTLYPDETLSVESVGGDTRVADADPQERIDGLYPDETLSVESVKQQIDHFDGLGGDASGDEGSSGSAGASSTASDNDGDPKGDKPSDDAK